MELIQTQLNKKESVQIFQLQQTDWNCTMHIQYYIYSALHNGNGIRDWVYLGPTIHVASEHLIGVFYGPGMQKMHVQKNMYMYFFVMLAMYSYH